MRWKLTRPEIYYIECRSRSGFIKLYEQKKCVDYADYLVGMYYISPFYLYYLKSDKTVAHVIIESLRKQQHMSIL